MRLGEPSDDICNRLDSEITMKDLPTYTINITLVRHAQIRTQRGQMVRVLVPVGLNSSDFHVAEAGSVVHRA
jgi:hypothetical protein